MTLKRKILLLISFLALSIILGMSTVYYYLFSDSVKESSRNQISLAVEYIFDDLIARFQRISEQAERFTRSALAGPFYLTGLFQQQYRELERKWGPREMRKILTYLTNISEGIMQLGSLINASQIIIYDQNGTLLAIYQLQEDPTTSVYLPEVFENELIPIEEEAGWFTNIRALEDIPHIELPQSIPMHYPKESFPEKTSANLSRFNGKLSMKFLVPIIQKGSQGLCLIQVPIHQNDVEHYARLSKTQINLFSGKTWSVGTLPDYPRFPNVDTNAGRVLNLHENTELPELTYSDAIIQGQAYYQGTTVLRTAQELLGAITIYLPRSAEAQQRNKFFIALMLTFLVFTVLTVAGAAFLSTIIVNPLKKLTVLIQHIAQGNLTSMVSQTAKTSLFAKQNSPNSRDEIVQLFASFQRMTHYLQEMAGIAEQISRGEIVQELSARSEHDQLGNAFACMAEYLKTIASAATSVSEGDLRMEISPKTEHDVLGQAFHRMTLLRQTMTGIMHEAGQLGQDSGGLNQISTQMASGAQQALERVQSLSTSSHQMNESVLEISTATRQMAANIHEISRHTDDVAQVVEAAVKTANSAGAAISELEKRSKEIGTIIKVITSITQQTNLLALNATIEAARAGDMGKGFAIVAGEVKDLARETAKSAEDIINRVEAIQTSSHEAAIEINEMAKTIEQVQQFTNIIVSAVTEQSATTEMISRNITDAAHVTEEVSAAITDMATVTKHSTELAQKVQHSSEQQAKAAEKLSSLVNRFKI